MGNKNFISLNDRDNVVVAIKLIKRGTVLNVTGNNIEVIEDIPQGHKIAITNIKKGENVIKYGFPIGYGTEDIKSGSLVHTHNVKTNLEKIETYKYNKKENNLKVLKKEKKFKGYVRENGKVGIRNEIFVIPTVGCVNQTAQLMVDEFLNEVNLDNCNIDGITVLKHPYGCSQLGDDHENTKKILANLVTHPNAGGVLVLGLGCENNTLDKFVEAIGEYNSKRVKFLVAQEVEDEIETGKNLLRQIYNEVKDDTREEVDLSKLTIGLKCGGSDGFSGITANPLFGVLSDCIIASGGSSILTEVPEMFGAETILMERAKDEEVFKKIVDMINGFKKYYSNANMPIYENPSPGNKKGGITTLEDKSLGCVQKGGLSTVVDVLKYGEKVNTTGLNLLYAPGNDLVASTALAASDCQMVLFSTGRGTPFGTVVPTIKVATNREIFEKKSNWMDYDASQVLDKGSVNDLLEDFLDFIIDIASGKKAKNEENRFKEIAIFKNGITL